MRGRLLLAAVAAVAAVAAAGCPHVPARLDPPIVALRGVHASVQAPAPGLDLRVELLVTNPNRTAMPLRAVDWELSIGEAGPVRGRLDRDDRVDGLATAPLGLSILVEAARAAGLTQAIAGGAETFHLGGVLHFESDRGDVAVPFDESGRLTQ